MMKPHIAPSLLSADFLCLRQQMEIVQEAGASVLHVDVMDGRFVPNISVGVPVVASLRRCGMTLDVHLMIVEPWLYLEAFQKAGANALTIHLEAVPECRLPEVLGRIRELGMDAGLSIKPDTPIEALTPWLPYCDLVLVMTVPPGFGGQSYDTRGDARLAEARKLIDAHNPDCLLSVDGGIDERTLPGAFRAGAERLVAGSAVFGQPDPGAAVKKLTALMR